MSHALAPWLLLLLGLAASLSVAVAMRPPRLHPVVLVAAFFSSWLTNELVLHQLLAQLLIGAALIAFGALDDWPGALGLALLSTASIGLLSVWARARKAGPTIADALKDAPGNTEPASWPRVPPTRRLLPLLLARRGVRRVKHIPFVTPDGTRRPLHLDLHLPDRKRWPGPRPAILQLHGGAWVIGDKSQQGLPLLNHLAANGWVGVNANYRHSPRATFPEHLIDVKHALAWIRANADEYGIDPHFIAITGGSAGGHLAALAALTANDPRYQPGFEHADTSVQAAVPFYAVYDFTDRLRLFGRPFVRRLLEPWVMKAPLEGNEALYREASPLDRVHPDAPPFLVVHGERDTLAPVAYARLFVERLREVSHAPVYYAELEGAQHAFDVFHSPRTDRVIEGVERFLQSLWGHAGAGRASERARHRPPGRS